MLALICHWSHYRKSLEHRDKSKALLKGILSQVLPPDDLTALLDMLPPYPATTLPCVNALQGIEGCSCWNELLESFAALTGHDSPQILFADMLLLASVPGRKHCVAVRQWLRDVLNNASALIDGAYGNWGSASWQKSAEASVQGRQKQRRISVQLKEWVSESVATRRFMSGEEAVHALDSTSASAYRNWRACDLCNLRFMMHESMHRCRNLSVAVDATRLGKPAQEWLFAVATQLDAYEHCSLPPQ
eukprot:4486788-Amphidinium_carterae.1